jgi:hypothetical protein
MIIDCMTCPVRGQRCDDCLVTALYSDTVTSGPEVRLDTRVPDTHLRDSRLHDTQLRDTQLRETELQLDAAERRAVSMFVGAGLVKRGAVAKLRASHESVDKWDPVREVG